MHLAGLEPASTNTMQLECTPLDHSGTDALDTRPSVKVYDVIFSKIFKNLRDENE
jgi:hypothetical protein